MWYVAVRCRDFRPLSTSVLKPLAIPAYLLPDQGHSLMTQSVLELLGSSSCLQRAQGNALAKNLGADRSLTDPCSCAKPNTHGGHALPGQRLLSLPPSSTRNPLFLLERSSSSPTRKALCFCPS